MPDQLVRALFPLLILFALQQLGSAGLIHAKAWMAPQLVQRAWSQTLSQGGEPVRPWPWADTWPVARLGFPERGIDQLVLAGDTGNALAFGPGYSQGSVLPGRSGETVISGHRDTHFAFLARVQLGEALLLQLPTGEVRRYRVSGIEVIDSSREGLVRSADREQLRLVTCYPFDTLMPGGPLRYVVTALPMPEAVAVSSSEPGRSARLNL